MLILFKDIFQLGGIMKSKWIYITAVVLGALFLRWYASLLLPIDYDEPVYYTAARYYADAIRTGQPEKIPGIPFNYEHPGLVKLVYGSVLSLLPSHGPVTDDVWKDFKFQIPISEARDPLKVFLLRQVSVFFGTVQVLLLAAVAPIAGLLLAIDSMAIKYTSVIYLEALPACLSMASVILFVKASEWLRNSKDITLKKNKKMGLMLILSAVFLGAAAASKYQYGIVGLAILIFYLCWIFPHHHRDFKRHGLIMGFFIISLLAFWVADPYLYPNPISRLIHSLRFSVIYSNSEAVEAAGYPFYQPLIWILNPVLAFVDLPNQPMPSRGNEFLFQWDTIIFILAVIGMPRMFKKQPVFFTWLITGLLFLLVWKTKWPQYTLLIVGPLCLAASEGVHTLIAFLKSLFLKSKRRFERVENSSA
jgi:hypothetical protein